MNKDWSDREVELTIADYFSMLIDEIEGNKFNKAGHNRALLPLLTNRNRSAIEFKHRNISAVLSDMGLPFITGYLPLHNIQKSKLVRQVADYVSGRPALEKNFNDFVNNIPQDTKRIDWDTFVESPPEKKVIPKEPKLITRRPLMINYLEREQNNRRLGIKGEEIAIEYEKLSLIKSGKESLAEKIEWISKDIGDGLGFDILSKNLDGSDKFIEVKTTKLSKEAPFFFSSNEYNFSLEKKSNYHLYRVFNFNDTPQMFTLQGSFDSFCFIEPVQYRGKFQG